MALEVKPLPRRAPLLANLRGHFAEFLNQSSLKRLGLLDPPTCVGLRYGLHAIYLEAFLGSMGSTASDYKVTASPLGLGSAHLTTPPAYRLAPGYPTPGRSTLLRPSIALAYKCRNINLLPINYAFRPRLRDRLTLGRLTLPRKP